MLSIPDRAASTSNVINLSKPIFGVYIISQIELPNVAVVNSCFCCPGPVVSGERAKQDSKTRVFEIQYRMTLIFASGG